LDRFWGPEKAIAFIDEGKRTAGQYNEAMEATAEIGRHWGKSCYYAGQRASQLSTNIRAMCSQLFCFAQGPKDAAILAEEWNQPELLKAPELNQGEYFLVRRFGKDRKKFCIKLDVFKEG